MRILAIDDPRWCAYVAGRAESTIFHHPAWAELLSACYGYAPMALAVTDGAAIAGGLPALDVRLPLRARRWVSLPFTDHCPPLGDDHARVVAALRALADASVFDRFELRAPVGEAAAAAPGGFVRHTLALTPDTAALWKGLRRNHRRSVQSAAEAGVRVERGTDAADLDTFYRIHLQTRRRLGVPVQPLRFFRLFGERIVRPGLGFVLTARRGGAPVAAAVFCAWNGTLVCKYSGRADGFERLDAIHLLFWTAIRWGAENGFHTFDLGRSGVEQAALRSFKTGWAAREEPLPYTHIGRAAAPSAHRMERLLAPVIQRTSPWVCRVLGEALYRYAA